MKRHMMNSRFLMSLGRPYCLSPNPQAVFVYKFGEGKKLPLCKTADVHFLSHLSSSEHFLTCVNTIFLLSYTFIYLFLIL